MKGEIIAIEGVCCAGKTTLVKKLSSNLKAGVVPELPEFGRNLFKPFSDGDSILYNSQQSIPIEQVRMSAAVGLSDLSPYVLLDRCFLSTLALGYGAIDLIGMSGYRELVDRVLAAVRNERLRVPDKALYISVDGKTVQKRNETRVPPLDEYWVDPNRVERQNVFYQILSTVEGIALVDGKQTREEVLMACIGLSHHTPKISSSSFLSIVEKFSNNIP